MSRQWASSEQSATKGFWSSLKLEDRAPIARTAGGGFHGSGHPSKRGRRRRLQHQQRQPERQQQQRQRQRTCAKMDPAMPLQQRITQGLSDVSQSFRNSISSLVLGAPNSSGSAAAGASTAGANGGGIAGVPDNDNNPSNSVDIDLEKGRAELESYAGGGRGDNDPHSQNGGGTDGGHATNNNDGSRADGDSTSGTAAVEGEGEDEADSASTTEPKPPVHHPQPRPLRLQTLPPEVQMLVIHRLNFGDIERLRRTCRHYHSLCSPHAIRTLFGAATLRLLMISHCGSCLRYDESRESLLIASVTGRDWPLNARCVDCAVSGRDRRLVVGRKITMGNGEGVWVCRWCGWPVVTDAAQGHAQFHEGCYDAYNRVLLWFFMLGWVQLGLGIVGAALAWRYFRDTTWILAPTVVSFFYSSFYYFVQFPPTPPNPMDTPVLTPHA